jgi:hypothetical protein
MWENGKVHAIVYAVTLQFALDVKTVCAGDFCTYKLPGELAGQLCHHPETNRTDVSSGVDAHGFH